MYVILEARDHVGICQFAFSSALLGRAVQNDQGERFSARRQGRMGMARKGRSGRSQGVRLPLACQLAWLRLLVNLPMLGLGTHEPSGRHKA